MKADLPTSNAETEPSRAKVTRSESTGKNTYGQILKASALIGGSSLLTIGISVIRTKAMALLLGPAGFGLTGLYLSVLDLARSVAAMGVNTSGVRQIAAAVGSGDEDQIARTALVLRRLSVLLGIVGAVLLALFSVPIARFTFGNDQYTSGVALLALAVLFNTISGGWDALIQGNRRIADLARIGVYGAAVGVVISVTIVFFFREQGIAPAIVAGAATSLSISWWYGRKVKIRAIRLTSKVIWQETAGLLKLGVAFFASAILTMGAAYAIRMIILREIGLEAAGFYQSAWALGSMYVGIVLQAMGSDFYPRLTAIAHDNKECNRLVNEQAEVGLLMAGPGVIATLTFAPAVIALFYTREFVPAVEPLRWLCLGLMLRVIAWPMGFIVLAKGAQTIFFWTELVANVVWVGLAWIAVRWFGLAGAGMAFFGLYIWHSILIYVIVRRLTGFRWSAANKKISLLILSLTGLVFIGFYVLPFWIAIAAGALTAAGSGIYAMRLLVTLVSPDRMPRLVRRVLALLRFTPRGS